MPATIPTHYKETTISNPGAIGGGIAGAAKTATDYVTEIDNSGITVHPKSLTTSRVKVDGNGTTIYQNNEDVAFYGATSRIGKANGDRVIVDSTNGITIYKANSKRLQTTANGVDVYGSDGSTSVASFGATTRIGKSAAEHVTVSSSSGRAEIALYGTSGSNKNASIYTKTVTVSGNDPVEQTGIELGKNASSVGPCIYAYIEDTSTALHVTTGANTSTRGAYNRISSNRRWVSDPDKLDIAEVYTHVKNTGTPPTAGFNVQSGLSSAELVLLSSGTYSQMTMVADRIVLNGNGVYPSYGFVSQGTTVPANGYVDHTISFGHTYQSAPMVLTSLISTSTGADFGQITIAVQARTTTGATIRIFNASSTNRTPGFIWLAIG